MRQTDSVSRSNRVFSPLVIAFIYLLVSVIWILFSDRVVELIVAEPASISSLQTLKGLGFVAATAALLFALIRTSQNRLRRSNEQLEHAREKLRLMLDSLSQGVIVADTDNRIIEFNPAALRMSGVTEPGALMGRSVYDFVAPQSRAKLTEDIRRTVSSGESGVIEGDIIRADGLTFPARYSSTLLKTPEGIPWGIVTLIEDVTERKEYTEKIIHLNRVLALIRDINQLIVQEEDETELLQKACRRTVANPDYALAWVALTDDHGEFKTAAFAGEQVNFELCLAEMGREPGEEITPIVHNNCANGLFAAAISLPLTVDGRAIGVFNICSPAAGAFADQEEYGLIAEVTQDLSLGIEKIRRRAEATRHLEELARRNRFIETVTDNLPIGLAVNAPGQPFRYMNRRFEEIYGWPVEIIADVEKFFEYVYPDPEFRRQIKDRVMADIESGDPARMSWEDVPVTHQDGSEHFISAANIPLAEQDLIISTVWDVTDRHQAIQELELRARLLDTSMDGIFVIDPETRRFRYFNETAHRSLGYSREEMEFLSLVDIIPESARATLPANIIRVTTAGNAVFETSHLTKDGRTFPVEVHAQTINIDGKSFMMGLAHDITERQAMQDRLIITDRMASVGELAAGIAHEINNPLTGVLGFAELLLEKKDLPEDIRQDVDTIYNEAKRTVTVVRNMLTFARRHDVHKRPVQINDIITETLKLRAYEHRANNIEVRTRLDAALPEITADPAQIQQVLLNIIINAEYVMSENNHGGQLSVSTETLPRAARITLANDGPPIPPEVKNKLFDPFFTTKPEGKGTGLGLSIVYRIITDHGGSVRVDSDGVEGTAFVIELPAINRELPTPN